MGAALLRIKIPSTSLETRQMVYFSAIASKLYLSLATCLDLGLIPRDFPLSMSLPTGMAPTSSTTTQSVPIHWQEEVWIETYAGDLGTTDTWCHRMVICTKGLSVGPGTQLTCYKGDPPHPVPLPPGPSRSRKTIFDAWNGYHSVALAKEDRHFTTFITPWGRYRYCSAPQEYIASGDAYTTRYDALIAHITNCTKCIDDALLWSDRSIPPSHRMARPLRHQRHNPEPEQIPLRLQRSGVCRVLDHPDRGQAIAEVLSQFPTPQGITDIRAWSGLVNQVAYAFSMASVMSPFEPY